MEYLGSLITRHEVETVDIFSSDELETLIKTAGFRLPPRSMPVTSPLVPYHHRLLEVMNGRGILIVSLSSFSFSFWS